MTVSYPDIYLRNDIVVIVLSLQPQSIEILTDIPIVHPRGDQPSDVQFFVDRYSEERKNEIVR